MTSRLSERGDIVMNMMIRMSIFVVGIITAITAALLMFVYGTEGLGFNPAVLGIFGIGLIATSNIRLLK